MNNIYGSYDIHALNAQYDLRPLWPDVPEVIKYRETESARVRQKLSGYQDLSYGEGKPLTTCLRLNCDSCDVKDGDNGQIKDKHENRNSILS